MFEVSRDRGTGCGLLQSCLFLFLSALLLLLLEVGLWLWLLGNFFLRGRELVREGSVPGSAEEEDVCAVFVFDTEDHPDGPTTDFGERDDETEYGGVLEVAGENGVEDPVETHDNVQDHGDVVDPYATEGEDFAQERVFGVCVAQTPVHCQVPDGDVDGVQKGKGDEGGLEAGLQTDSIHAQGGVVKHGEDVFAKVHQMGEDVAGVGVTTQTLECTPYGWQTLEETERSRMRRVALWWIIPVFGIQAEEQCDVLTISLCGCLKSIGHLLPWHMSANSTYRPERNLEIQPDTVLPMPAATGFISHAQSWTANQKTYIRIRPPLSTAMVEHTSRQEKKNQGQAHEHDRPIDIHVIDNEKIEPHKQAQKKKEERW